MTQAPRISPPSLSTSTDRGNLHQSIYSNEHNLLFEFDGLIWTKTKIELNEQHHPEDPMAPTSMPTTR